MPLARSRLRVRRTELMHAHTGLNLIPLVDILTAIVFFSLLSAVTLRSALASFDLAQAPALGTANATTGSAATATPELVVRVDRDRIVVRHPRGETAIGLPQGTSNSALVALHRTLTELTTAPGRRVRIAVVPSDDVLYDDLIRVLDEVHRVNAGAVFLSPRARQ